MSFTNRMAKIFGGLNDAPHGFKQSLTIFQELNLDIAKRDLHIEERAEIRAKDDEPALGSTTLDPVENEIIDHVESVKNRDRQMLTDNLEVYTDRLASLNFEGRLSDINIGIQEAKAELRQIVETGLDKLHPRRRALLLREGDLEVFREINRLRRAAHYPGTGKKVLLYGIVAVLLLLETIGNTTFLAKGNELGIFGAYNEAVVISGLNLGGAIILALTCRNIVHVKISRKLVGWLAAILYLCLLIGLNIFVAHYRDVSGVLLENGGVEVMRRLRVDPLALADAKSWLLFGMGCLFSIISFWDAFQWDDFYPGYGRETRAVYTDQAEYTDEREHHSLELASYLSDGIEMLRSTKNDLMDWRKTHTAILESRKRLLEAFDAQIVHLERAGNTLLAVYREANRKAREGNAPKRFKEPWKMSLPHIDREIPLTALDMETMDRLIKKSEGQLEAGVSTLNDEYTEGLRKFRNLDDLVKDEIRKKASDGPAE